MATPAPVVKKKIAIKIHTGMRCSVNGEVGTIRFYGETKFAEGKWVGVELDAMNGKNDGSVKGDRYFDCKMKYGLFTKANTIKPLKTKTATKNVASSASSPPKKSPSKASSLTASVKDKQAALKKLQAKKKALTEAPKGDSSSSDPTIELKQEIRELRERQTKSVEDLEVLKKENRLLTQQLSNAQSTLASTAAEGKAGISELAQIQGLNERKILGELAEANSTIEKLNKQWHDAQEGVKKSRDVPILQMQVKDLTVEVSSLKLEKDMALENVGELEQRLELAREELEIAKLELEELQDAKDASSADIIASLPSGQAEMATVVSERDQLADALRKLRDQAVMASQKANDFKSSATEQIETLTQKAERLVKAEADLVENKRAVAELKRMLDEASTFEQMVEEMAEKNAVLQEQAKEMRSEISYLNDANALNDEVEEAHIEVEQQLQSEMDKRDSELFECHRQIKLKQNQIEDLTNTQRQFRELVREMENEQASVQSEQQDDSQKSSRNRDRLANLQLRARVGDAKQRAVDLMNLRLEAQQASKQLSFLKSHIPDNLEVDTAAIETLSSVERIRGKALGGARLLAEHFGGKSGDEKLAQFTYGVCNQLCDVAKSMDDVTACMRKADVEPFALAVDERGSLADAEKSLDDLLAAAARDEFGEDFPTTTIQVSQEQIVGFLHAHFARTGDDGVPSLGNTGAVTVELDIQKLCFQQAYVQCLFDAITNLFGEMPKAEEGAPTDKFAVVWENITAANSGNSDLVEKMRTQAQSYQLLSGRGGDSSALGGPVKQCTASIFNIQVRLQQLLEWAVSVVRSGGGGAVEGGEGASADRDRVSQQLEVRLETETADRRLLSEITTLDQLLKDLQVQLQSPAPARDEEAKIPSWETKASKVRQELMESANLSTMVEQQAKKISEKTSELFHASKLARDRQAKVDVLSQKLDQLSNRAGESEDLRYKVKQLERTVEENTTELENTAADLDKYAKANKTLRKKVFKLKYEVKVAQDAKAKGGGANTGVVTASGKDLVSLQQAAGEVDMLYRTVGVLRHQLTTVRHSEAMASLARSLPPLPFVRFSPITNSSNSTTAQALARQQQGLFGGSPFSRFARADNNTVSSLQSLASNCSALTAKVSNFRATASLVDISKVKPGGVAPDEEKQQDTPKHASPGQQWLVRQLEAGRLSKQASSLSQAVLTFLTQQRVSAFGAPCIHVPSSAIPASQGKLIGRVMFPSSPATSTSKILMGGDDLMRLQSVFVQ